MAPRRQSHDFATVTAELDQNASSLTRLTTIARFVVFSLTCATLVLLVATVVLSQKISSNTDTALGADVASARLVNEARFIKHPGQLTMLQCLYNADDNWTSFERNRNSDIMSNLLSRKVGHFKTLRDSAQLIGDNAEDDTERELARWSVGNATLHIEESEKYTNQFEIGVLLGEKAKWFPQLPQYSMRLFGYAKHYEGVRAVFEHRFHRLLRDNEDYLDQRKGFAIAALCATLSSMALLPAFAVALRRKQKQLDQQLKVSHRVVKRLLNSKQITIEAAGVSAEMATLDDVEVASSSDVSSVPDKEHSVSVAVSSSEASINSSNSSTPSVVGMQKRKLQRLRKVVQFTTVALLLVLFSLSIFLLWATSKQREHAVTAKNTALPLVARSVESKADVSNTYMSLQSNAAINNLFRYGVNKTELFAVIKAGQSSNENKIVGAEEATAFLLDQVQGKRNDALLDDVRKLVGDDTSTGLLEFLFHYSEQKYAVCVDNFRDPNNATLVPHTAEIENLLLDTTTNTSLLEARDESWRILDRLQAVADREFDSRRDSDEFFARVTLVLTVVGVTLSAFILIAAYLSTRKLGTQQRVDFLIRRWNLDSIMNDGECLQLLQNFVSAQMCREQLDFVCALRQANLLHGRVGLPAKQALAIVGKFVDERFACFANGCDLLSDLNAQFAPLNISANVRTRVLRQALLQREVINESLQTSLPTKQDVSSGGTGFDREIEISATMCAMPSLVEALRECDLEARRLLHMNSVQPFISSPEFHEFDAARRLAVQRHVDVLSRHGHHTDAA
ncbi:MAG: hypothetical protein MHM6MM_000878 [Cercozoa sp. M6MM]